MRRLAVVLLTIGGFAFLGGESFAKTKVFVYPKENQAQEQQELDEKECHGWAREQTGYDLDELDEGQEKANQIQEVDRYQKSYEDKSKTLIQKRSEELTQIEKKIDEYLRAFSVCMEARGYSVR